MTTTSMHARVAGHCRRLTGHGDQIARQLLVRRIGDPIEVRRSDTSGRGSGISRPTEGTGLDWDQAQRSDARRLARLLIGDSDLVELQGVRGAADIAAGLDHPLPDTTSLLGVDTPVTDVIRIASRRHPNTVEWRASIRALGMLWHVAANQIHDGWTALYTSRWVDDGHDGVMLNEQVEVAVLDWAGHIGRLERALWQLEQRLTPANLRICAGDGCRHPVEPDDPAGMCRDCDTRPCACDQACDRTVARGQGKVHPNCRTRQWRERTRT